MTNTDLYKWNLSAEGRTFVWSKDTYKVITEYKKPILEITIKKNTEEIDRNEVMIPDTNTVTVEHIRRMSQEKLTQHFKSW